MWWALLLVAMFFALHSLVRYEKTTGQPQALGIDFANSPERVEMTLRTLAAEVERKCIYDLSVYFASEDVEAHTIAMRLGQYIPLHLSVDTPAAIYFIKVNDFPPERTLHEMRNHLHSRCRQAGGQ